MYTLPVDIYNPTAVLGEVQNVVSVLVLPWSPDIENGGSSRIYGRREKRKQ